MAQIFGLTNYLITQVAMTLMNNEYFSKLVYYVDEDVGTDIFQLDKISSPIEALSQGDIATRKVFLGRRIKTDKIQQCQDVNIFIHLRDSKNYKQTSHHIKTVYISVIVLVHEQCIPTAHGGRDSAIVNAIENAVEGQRLTYAVGECRVFSTPMLEQLPPEYSGYEVVLQVDGFPTKYEPLGIGEKNENK